MGSARGRQEAGIHRPRKERGLERSEGLGSIPAVPYSPSTCSSLSLRFVICTMGKIGVSALAETDPFLRSQGTVK